MRVAPSVTAATTHLRVTLVDGAAAVDLPVATSPRAFMQVGGAVAVVAGGREEAVAFARMPHVYSVA